MKVGEVIKIEAMRVPIYRHENYMPAEKRTVKTIKVLEKRDRIFFVQDIRTKKKFNLIMIEEGFGSMYNLKTKYEIWF